MSLIKLAAKTPVKRLIEISKKYGTKAAEDFEQEFKGNYAIANHNFNKIQHQPKDEYIIRFSPNMFRAEVKEFQKSTHPHISKWRKNKS